MHTWENPIFSSLTVLYVAVAPGMLVTTGQGLLCGFLSGGSWPRSKLICWHLTGKCAPNVQSWRALTQTWPGPGEQFQLCPALPWASTTRQLAGAHTRAQGTGADVRAKCDGAHGARPWPGTVSEEGAQGSLAMTVKLKGRAFEAWGWLLCDLLGTSPYE